MTTLEQANKNLLRLVEQAIQREIRIAKEASKFWKGKKIIALREWEKIQNQGTNEELKFIPDDYPGLVFFDQPDDKKIIQKRMEWYDDYVEYLLFTKNEEYGMARCERCAIHDQNRTSSKIVKDILLENCFEEKIADPCTVCNSMKCPHPDKMNALFSIKTIWGILDKALWFAHSLHREQAYVDFTLQRADGYEYMSYNGGVLRYSIDEYLEKRNRPLVHINRIRDIYDILRDSEKLRAVLLQYIDSIEDDLQKGKTKESTERADDLRTMIEPIVEIFSDIKDKIRFENFRGLYGQTLEDEQKRIAIDLENKKKRDSMPKERKFYSCKDCFEDGVFYCSNCHVRICEGHFADHRKYHAQNIK